MKTKKKKVKKKTKSKSKPKRNKDGHFLPGESGNLRGRPTDTSFMDEFREAMATTEKKKKKSLLLHFCERAFVNDKVLIACVNRLLPVLSSIDVQTTIESSMFDETAESIRKKLVTRFATAKT